MAKTVDINLVIKTAGSEKTIEEANQNLKDLQTTAEALGGSFDNAFSQSLNSAIKKTTENIDKLSTAAKEAGDDIKNGFDKGKNATENLENVGVKTLGKLRKELAQLIAEQSNLDKGSERFKQLTIEIQNTEKAVKRAEGAFGDAADSIKTLSGSRVERLRGSFGLLRESIVNLDFDKFKIGAKGVGDAIGGIGGAIKASGIGLLVLVVAQIIANFDKLKQSGGLLGGVLTAIGNITKTVVQGLKDLSDFLGLTDTKSQEAAEAQEKFGGAIRETNTALGAARRKELVLTGQLTEEAAARANAKEKFITDFLKVQEEARKAIREAGSSAEIKAIEQDRDAKLKLLQQEYKNELIEISNQEKKKKDDALKAEQDKQKAISDKVSQENKARAEKEAEQRKTAREALKQQELAAITAQLDEVGKIFNDSNNEIIAAEENFRKAKFQKGSDEEKAAAEALERTIQAIKSKAQADADAILDAEAKERQKVIDEENNAIARERIKQRVQQVKEVEAKLAEDARLLELQKQAEFDQLSLAQQAVALEEERQQILENEELTESERFEINKKYDNLIEQNRKARIQKGFEIAKAAAGALGALNDLLTAREQRNAKLTEAEAEKLRQKQFKREKALALVNAGIGTAEAIVKASPNPALIAFAAVTGALQIAAIASKKYQPDNETPPTVSEPTAPSEDAVSGGIAPAAGLVGLTQIGALTPQNNRVFVVESDITSTINRVQVAENQSKFG